MDDKLRRTLEEFNQNPTRREYRVRDGAHEYRLFLWGLTLYLEASRQMLLVVEGAQSEMKTEAALVSRALMKAKDAVSQHLGLDENWPPEFLEKFFHGNAQRVLGL